MYLLREHLKTVFNFSKGFCRSLRGFFVSLEGSLDVLLKEKLNHDKGKRTNNFYPENDSKKLSFSVWVERRTTTTSNPSAIHKSMFLYPADKIFIEPCPLNQPIVKATLGGKEVRVEAEVTKKYIWGLKNRILNLQIQHAAMIRILSKSFSRKVFTFFFSPEHELEKAFSEISVQFISCNVSFNIILCESISSLRLAGINKVKFSLFLLKRMKSAANCVKLFFPVLVPEASLPFLMLW